MRDWKWHILAQPQKAIEMLTFQNDAGIIGMRPDVNMVYILHPIFCANSDGGTNETDEKHHLGNSAGHCDYWV